MKRILMAIMAVAVAVTFSAPSFADDTKKPVEKKDEKKGGHVLVYADEKKKDEKKDEKKPHAEEDKGEKKKKDEKGK
jgi:Ni/Co efflux regulator RcnB